MHKPKAAARRGMRTNLGLETRLCMNCLARSAHSFKLLRSTGFPNKHPPTLITQFSVIRPIEAPSFCSAADGHRSTPIPPFMDVDPTERAPPPAEDFVHVENPGPTLADSLSESIVRVEHDTQNDDGNDCVPALEGSGSPERTKAELPEELARSVMVLTCESRAEGGICDVYIVGTAHVSQESCQEVETVISCLKPQAVFLELCSSRVAVLTPQNLKVPTLREMIEMYKNKHNLFGILYSWFLAKVAHKLEVFPGSEFRVAFQEALKYGGKVVLGDRPVQVTLRRTWVKMPLWHKVKLLYSMLFQAVFLPSAEDLNKMLKDMGDVDMLTLVIQEMSKEFPTLMETLVHERDQYMSSSLLRVARENSSVVAVVGKGHMQGIKKHWEQPISVKDLMEIPATSKKPGLQVRTILASLGVAVAGVAIISGLYVSIKKSSST